MGNISDFLGKILSARYGKDVRQSIHDAIQQCYYDGKAGSIDIEARESIETIGNNKLDKKGDSASNTVTFTSGDSTSPTGWADIVAVASGETHASLFRKFSLTVKNLRYLYKMLGNTDISAIGDGTITGAISTQNSNLNSLIKTDTATVTTDASGNAMLPLSREKILVSVDCTSHNGVRCMTMTANNNWYVFPLANSLTFSPYANQSMTFKYYYV